MFESTFLPMLWGFAAAVWIAYAYVYVTDKLEEKKRKRELKEQGGAGSWIPLWHGQD